MPKDRQITGIKTWPEDDRPREKSGDTIPILYSCQEN